MELESAVIARLAYFCYVITEQDKDGWPIPYKKRDRQSAIFVILPRFRKGCFMLK